MANNYAETAGIKKSEAKRKMTNDQLVKCNIAIHSASVAAGAEAFVPIPMADAIPISATQIAMVVALGGIFGKKLTKSTARGILAAAASTLIGRNVVKLIPIAGWIASSTVAVTVTEAIGWTVAVDFADEMKEISGEDGVVEPNESSDEKEEKTNGTDQEETGTSDDSAFKAFKKEFEDEEE